MGAAFGDMAILNFLLIATGAISQICAALPSTWPLPTTAVVATSSAGSLRWEFNIPLNPKDPFPRQPRDVVDTAVVTNNTVVFGSYDTNLYAVHAENGAQKWVAKTGYDITMDPTLSPDAQVVYFTSNDKALYNVDTASGKGYVLAGGEINGVFSSPELNSDGSIIYAAGFSATLFALEVLALPPKAPSGAVYRVKWQTGEMEGAISTRPLLSPDEATLYVSLATGPIYALHSATGKTKWAFSQSATVVTSPVLTPDGATLFFATYNNSLLAVNTKDGSPKWSFDIKGPNYGSRPAVSADGKKVFVGSDAGNLYAVHVGSGIQDWVLNIGDAVNSPPHVSKDGTTIYVGSDSGNVHAVDVATGAPKWTFRADGSVKAEPVESADGAAIFFGTKNGTFYAVHA